MPISSSEKSAAGKLRLLLLRHCELLPYSNFRNGINKGWTYDFHLRNYADNPVRLNLHRSKDLFLLLVFAFARAQRGRWENAVHFTTFLKIAGRNEPAYWTNIDHVLEDIGQRDFYENLVPCAVNVKVIPRDKITFNETLFYLTHKLAKNWTDISDQLQQARQTGDYVSFMHYITLLPDFLDEMESLLEAMPLVLRELRCQGIADNIPGELCCVLDKRVLNSAGECHIHLEKPYNIRSFMDTSAKVYSLFGDLYDLPLFAWKDLRSLGTFLNLNTR